MAPAPISPFSALSKNDTDHLCVFSVSLRSIEDKEGKREKTILKICAQRVVHRERARNRSHFDHVHRRRNNTTYNNLTCPRPKESVMS